MPTLLLTSAGMAMQEEILKLLPKPPEQIRLAHVITASKPEQNRSYVAKDAAAFAAFGFQVIDVDIEGMDEEQVRSALAGVDAVYVQGGNTFFLLKASRESGFDRVVKELVERGVIYIGASAGSYVAGASIESAGWKHADKNRWALKDLTGFNLVPFVITAHYNPQYADILRAEIVKCKHPLRILTDDQALLVRDGQVELVGKGPEVKL